MKSLPKIKEYDDGGGKKRNTTGNSTASPEKNLK